MLKPRSFALFVVYVAFYLVTSGVQSQTALRLDQGAAWTPALRQRYHHLDQGSRLIPLAWLSALEQTDGSGFLSDKLVRYGFLPDADDALEVGMSVASSPNGRVAGLTCAACHTREIEVEGRAWRIEGAPAFIDLQRFFADLDDSVRGVLSNDRRFASFADRIVGSNPHDRRKLLKAVRFWSLRFHAYISALPMQPWGPGRLDAFGLIFNQLAGLDVGPGPTGIIAENIAKADAPVRFPFLWNSPFQDKTDWPGFADNGNERAALARNISEALGVFAMFHPKPSLPGAPLDRDYLADNSENIVALQELEAGMVALKPPAWPWPIVRASAAKGREIFDRPKELGGCVECHGLRPGAERGSRPTFATPVLDVGTDTRVWHGLPRVVRTGAMAGALVPGEPPLAKEDRAARLLKATVIGILLEATAAQHVLQVPTGTLAPVSPGVVKALEAQAKPPVANVYEARVLAGVWAAAPYLHNGSVPTLADLLQVPARRPRQFAVGSAYDLSKVGLARDQAPGTFVFEATGCEAIDSGNSNCGHEYGTLLTEDEKAALVEYLKTL